MSRSVQIQSDLKSEGVMTSLDLSGDEYFLENIFLRIGIHEINHGRREHGEYHDLFL